MLTIAKLGGHSVAYYESTVDRDQAANVGADLADYYGEHGDQTPRVWAAGPGAFGVTDALGVTVNEPVSRQAVESWIGECCNPSTGDQLGRKVDPERAVLGFDLTFGAPKSVSMAWALSEDEALREAIATAHDAAIDSALDYLAEHAGWTRRHDEGLTEQRGKQTKRLEKLNGLAGVRYRHRTSRAGDMHLHSHVLLSNRQQTADGSWLSVDGTSLYHEARAGGSVYQATLRAALAERGLTFEATDLDAGFAELAGIDEADREAWSQRHTEIEAWLDEHGITNRGAAAQGVAQKDTRTAKELGHSDDELREIWKADDRAVDVDAALAQTRGADREVLPAESVPTPESVLTLVGRTRSTFTRADVVEAACALMPPTADLDGRSVVEAVEALADEALELSAELSLGGAEGRKPWEREGSVSYTTPEIVREEAQALETAAREVEGLGVDGSDIQAAEGVLSEEQAEAMRAVVSSDRRVSVLVAPAGAGKTYGLRLARQVWEVEADRTVVGYAPSGRAADQLAADNAVEEAGTIATLLGRLDRGDGSGWDADTVVVVDEAGMAATPDLARMIAEADEAGAKLVLVGDPQQLGSVKARGGLLDVMRRDLDSTVELSEVYRQQDPAEAEASKALRDGDLDGADWYRENGRITSGSLARMLDMAAGDYLDNRREGHDAMIVAPTREIVDALNQRIQRDRVVAGELDHTTGRGIARGLWACEGDPVVTTRNNYQLHDGTGSAIRNGQRWTVVSLDEHGGLIVERPTDNGPTRAVLPADYVTEHVGLGYALTVHAAQGATADTCAVVMDVDRTDARTAYVGMTRGRTCNRGFVFERRVGEDAHQHRSDDAAEAEQRLDSPTEAWERFGKVMERQSGDRAAHTVMRDRLNEQRNEYRTRTGKVWEEAREAAAEELLMQGQDPADHLPQPSQAEQWDAARTPQFYDEQQQYYEEDSYSFAEGVLSEMTKPEGPGMIRKAAEVGSAFLPDGGITNAAMQLYESADDAFYREDGLDAEQSEDRDSGLDL